MLKFRAPIRYAVAYGSGVYQQQGYTENHQKKTMVDMVFAVTHPEHWHAINMQQHREHYSMMSRMLGSASVSFIQEKLGAGVYYNTYVEMEGVQLKYGVISVDSMTNDLLGWTSMYLAGRLHKPTLVLQDDPFIRLCEQVNLANAVRVALLMLPKNFTERELFATIASLSYMGDFRMIYGENPNKVRNIVDAQLPSFRELYSGTIEGFSNLKYIGMNFLQQDMDPIVRARMLSKLPQQICTNTVKLYSRSSAYPSSLSSSSTTSSESLSNIDPALLSVVQHPELLPLFLTSSIRSIVARPALTQSLKGIYSAGFSKSASYLWDKLNKSKL
ncbi:Phosphatidate cytidylyltransferase, mitochondrial [Zancudomyces culisetae]|uniref:Phosphatidate cytidylyltransferase, mitochondrial n=1 Tax=Zancudomyces culisetae TaxID=1213189 RepID=A0A1R1PTY3_ZANCU|nr:Phosphatidate cytidylyltransferase, mitochondrial [Zancudomyces culisetae]|eukprot:OMH84379.1 Phosphatidate cytidylyltransferase, mitochondrial [Zancudomyces culisetae]